MVAQARAAAGFTTLKIKLGFDGDLELAERLARELPGTTLPLRRQRGLGPRAGGPLAGRAGRPGRRARRAAAAGRRPSKDRRGCATASPLPLFADEAVLGVDELEDVAELYDGVVVKLAEGGRHRRRLRPGVGLHGPRPARAAGLHGGVALGVAAGLQLAGLADYVDLDGALLLAADPFRGIEVDGDRLTASSAPGLGVTAARY